MDDCAPLLQVLKVVAAIVENEGPQKIKQSTRKNLKRLARELLLSIQHIQSKEFTLVK
jgi:hypothetical protein